MRVKNPPKAKRRGPTVLPSPAADLEVKILQLASDHPLAEFLSLARAGMEACAAERARGDVWWLFADEDQSHWAGCTTWLAFSENVSEDLMDALQLRLDERGIRHELEWAAYSGVKLTPRLAITDHGVVSEF